MAQTLEQKRAQHAWNKAQEGVARYGKDYVNDAKGLPALIMNSGLMQVMAFLHEKGGRHETLSDHLRDWLQQRGWRRSQRNTPWDTPWDFADFMQTLLTMQARDFQAITTEAFAWLKWLRQIAPAVAKE
jgi:CRISPR-associated protein Cmr5